MSENIQYYGFVDSIEHGTLRQVAFDCFPADQLAKLLEHPSSIIDVPTYSIQMKDDDLRKVPEFNSRQLRPSRWYLLTLGANGHPAKKFARIDSDEYESLLISRIDSLHKRHRDIKGLYLLSLMDGIRDTTKDELVQIFSSLKVEEAAFVAVYKVGQGNCNAVCDNYSAPLLYFDFGGGCYSHASTYPINQKYCFTHKPPILLSHWDFDHWAAATREPKVKNLVWIVPRQLIGPTHLKFARELYHKGNLRIWSNKNLDTPLVSIYKCTGRNQAKRNDNGLALLVNLPTPDRHYKILLPGDAAFKHIPLNPHNDLDGFVASHHGGFIRNDQCPVSAGNGSIIFSFGIPNSYGHPDQRAIIRYLLNGWSRQISTHNGHAAIGWSGCSLPNLGCGGNLCDLSIKQV